MVCLLSRFYRFCHYLCLHKQSIKKARKENKPSQLPKS
jgi:hypothetical protein